MPETMVRVRSGLPRVFDAQIECPAGEPIGETLKGSGCACHVEDNVLLSSTDPASLMRFCLGDYRICPTWRTEKDWIAANRQARSRALDA